MIDLKAREKKRNKIKKLVEQRMKDGGNEAEVKKQIMKEQRKQSKLKKKEAVEQVRQNVLKEMGKNLS